MTRRARSRVGEAARLFAAALAVLLAACGGAQTGPGRTAPTGPTPVEPGEPVDPLPVYRGELVASGELVSPPGLGEDFLLRQQVVAHTAEGEYRFQAVLQKRDGELVLIGLGPHGGRGFVLRQRGRQVEFQNYLPDGRTLPFPARFMLIDVQRVWFWGLPGPRPDGVHRGRRGDETITERWAGGALRERRFARVSGEPDADITIRYTPALGPGRPPTQVELDNAWFGYRLSLATLAHEVLSRP